MFGPRCVPAKTPIRPTKDFVGARQHFQSSGVDVGVGATTTATAGAAQSCGQLKGSHLLIDFP